METIAFDVSPEAILAMKVIAPTSGSNERIQSIFAEIGDNDIIIGATDKFIILVHRLEKQKIDLPRLSVAIPIHLFSGIKKNFGPVTIKLSPHENNFMRDVSVSQIGVTAAGKTIRFGPLPWRTVVPESISYDNAQYNPKHLAKFAKVHKILNPKAKRQHVYIHYNGRNPAVVSLGREDYFALIAPIDIKMTDCQIPDWVK